MKYDQETTTRLISRWQDLGATSASIPALALEFDTTERSIIAKLSSLGIYKRQTYTDKQGNPPVKKEVYVERIANLLEMNVELLESLEKVNKNVLKVLEQALSSAISKYDE